MIRYSIVVLSIFLAGCFDITEEITVNRDGSGQAKIIIDLSAFSGLLNSKLASGENSDSTLNKSSAKKDSSIAEIKNKLEKINGVSNVFAGSETNDLLFVIRFDFKNDHALNAALNNLFSEIQKGDIPQHVYYSFSKGLVQRNNIIFLDDVSGNNKSSDEMQEAIAASFLTTSKYHVKINLPANAKKINVDNSNALLGNKGNMVMVEETFMEIKEKKSSLALKIKYQ